MNRRQRLPGTTGANEERSAMYFSGISDEAGQSIHTQIKAHKELGWENMELRAVDGEFVSMMPDEAFDEVSRAIASAGMKVSCFASAIANWSRPITADPAVDYEELRRAIPRMHRFGCRFIRVMSYPNDRHTPWEEPRWKRECIERLKRLTGMAEEGRVVLVHENCSGWGGVSPENNRALLDEIDSPAFSVVFDTGNPVEHNQNAWAYYRAVLDDIAYVHIKDGCRLASGELKWCFPGEGEGDVQRIVSDLLGRGYDGGFSIEPHIASVIHTGEEAASEQELYDSYLDYGRRFMAIAEKARDPQR